MSVWGNRHEIGSIINHKLGMKLLILSIDFSRDKNEFVYEVRDEKLNKSKIYESEISEK